MTVHRHFPACRAGALVALYLAATRPGGVASAQGGCAGPVGARAADSPLVLPAARAAGEPSALAAAPAATRPDSTGIVIPNDPYFWSGQPNLRKAIQATDAWGVSYGASDVTVAVISSGIDLTHPDLASKLWHNPGELPGNGVDDDANGYVDDYSGWNFAGADAGEGPVPADFVGGRGTMSAGIIGARTHNRTGVAGVSWGAQLMPLKILSLDQHGTPRGRFDDVTRAICYAADNGARVIYVEGYFVGGSLTVEQIIRLEQAVEYAHTRAGAVVVAPAGDCGDNAAWCPRADGGSPAPVYPAAITHVIGVQAADPETMRQRSSASHGSWVDLTAPGEEFWTTFPRAAPGDLGYTEVTYTASGNAISNYGAAHVAGAAAVLLGLDPRLSPLQVEQLLCASAGRREGGPYPFVDGRYWNERYGCGTLDLDGAASAAPWVPRLAPRAAHLYTDGVALGPAMVFTSLNLNEGAWELRSSEPWVRVRPEPQVTGWLSSARVAVDLEELAANVGRIQAGRVYTAELQACPIPDARGTCWPYTVSLSVVDTLQRLLLPSLSNH